jgi:dihydropyrimidine dehydrogenase (NAD+) subunit PreA
MNVDLAVDFCGVRFVNPFVLASSPCTASADMVARAFEHGWAGAALRTTSTAGTEVNMAYPIMSSLNRNGRMIGLHNIDLISERPIHMMAEDVRQLKREYPERVVIGSIVGDAKAEWQSLAQQMAAAGADIVECSLSCPQGSAIDGQEVPMGSMVSQDPGLTRKVAQWIKEAIPATPVTVKLTSGVTDLGAMVRSVQESGADGVCLIDSVAGIGGVDLDTLEPLPSVQGHTSDGGYTGRAIKPIALRCVVDAARASSLPIAGVGGIYDWRDAAEFLLLGATTVQVCTAVMELGFGIAEDLTDGLSRWLGNRGYAGLRDIIGLSLPRIVEHDDLPRGIEVRARIDVALCIGCERCHVACRDGGHQAITWDEALQQPVVDDEKCVGCGLCPQVCPVPDCIAIVNHEVPASF